MSATIKVDHSLPPSTTWPCVQAFENDPPSRHGAHRSTNPERGRMRDEYPGNCAASAIQTQKNAAKKQLRENLVVIVACCLQASRNKSFCPASEQSTNQKQQGSLFYQAAILSKVRICPWLYTACSERNHVIGARAFLAFTDIKLNFLAII